MNAKSQLIEENSFFFFHNQLRKFSHLLLQAPFDHLQELIVFVRLAVDFHR
jgi:hypothetical protein